MFHDNSDDDDDNGNENALDLLMFKFRTWFNESDLLGILEHDVFSRLATCGLNLSILFSGPHDLQFIETPYIWGFYFLLSLAATYRYLMNTKCYDIFKYEELYKSFTGDLSDRINQLKKANKEAYKNEIRN